MEESRSRAEEGGQNADGGSNARYAAATPLRGTPGQILVRYVTIVGLLTGCAGNTAQQDMVYRAWENCRVEGRIAGQVEPARVEPDGRYWIQPLPDSRSAYGVGPAQACVDEHLAKMRQVQ